MMKITRSTKARSSNGVMFSSFNVPLVGSRRFLHGVSPAASSTSNTSNLTSTRGGKFVGGARFTVGVAARACRTEASQRSCPEPFFHDGFEIRPVASTDFGHPQAVLHVGGTIPLRPQGVFQEALIELDRIAAGAHRAPAAEGKRRHFDGRRRHHGRGGEDLAEAAPRPWRHGPKSPEAVRVAVSPGPAPVPSFPAWPPPRTAFPVRAFLLRRFLLHHLDGDFLQFLAQQPFACGEIEQRDNDRAVGHEGDQ